MIDSATTVFGPGILTNQILRLKQVYRSWFPEDIRRVVYELYRRPALYVVVPFLLFLELLFPCNPSQPLISKGFLQDAVWFVAFAPMKILMLYPIGACIESVFKAHHELFDIGAAAAWPIPVRVIAALLLGELLFWCNHLIRHKVRMLWLFHAIHHSQTETNAFTDDREHIVDAFLGSLLHFFPFFLFQLPNFYAVAVIGLYLPIHNRFIHANLKMNLGWLGFLITSPQFHRVHHSAAPEHLDKNFGAHFSLFDYLFGTACRSNDVYPETGIADARFPIEDRLKWRQLPGNWLKQTVYPFTQLLKEQQVLHRARVFIERARHNRRGLPQRPIPD